jgi:hypothetical protein
MSTRATSWLAWALVTLSVVLFLAAIALQIVTLPVRPPSRWGTGGISTPLWAILPFLPFPIVGALIASRRPGNPIGWLSSGPRHRVDAENGYRLLRAVRPADGHAGLRPLPGGSRLAGRVSTAAGHTARDLPDPAVPRREAPSSRWRPVAWLCGTVIATNIVAGVLLPGPLSELRNVRNPFGLEGQPWLADANEAIGLLFPLCLLGSASSLIVRHIRAGKRCASRSSGWPSRPRLSPSGPRER